MDGVRWRVVCWWAEVCEWVLGLREECVSGVVDTLLAVDIGRCWWTGGWMVGRGRGVAWRAGYAGGWRVSW